MKKYVTRKEKIEPVAQLFRQHVPGSLHRSVCGVCLCSARVHEEEQEWYQDAAARIRADREATEDRRIRLQEVETGEK
jgi:hypothetical protein